MLEFKNPERLFTKTDNLIIPNEVSLLIISNNRLENLIDRPI